MEKKTMGAFISALRRAAGMTQRELGERLFVSDKTVSRWERDECTPELSLIPVIADLFGVTADELLRGERNGTTSAPSGETVAAEPTPHQRAKSERSLRMLLERRMVQFKNHSLISVGIALLGVIVAAIINLGILRAQIAFWTATALLLASAICQICFYTSARMRVEEDEEQEDASRANTFAVFNSRCLLITKNVLLSVLCLLAFCLPLAALVGDAYAGLQLDSWLLCGAAFAAIMLMGAYSLWELVIRRRLTAQGHLLQTEQEAACYAAERKLLGRSLSLFIAVGVLTLVASTVVQSIDGARFSAYQILDTKEDFIAFAEAEDPYDEILVYKGWFTEVHQSVPVEQEPTYRVDVEEVWPSEEDEYLRTVFYGRDGEELFTYIDRRNISRIGLSDTEDGFPVKVYTSAQISAGYSLRNSIETAITLAYGVFGAVVVAVYVKKLLILRKKSRE